MKSEKVTQKISKEAHSQIMIFLNEAEAHEDQMTKWQGLPSDKLRTFVDRVVSSLTDTLRNERTRTQAADQLSDTSGQAACFTPQRAGLAGACTLG